MIGRRSRLAACLVGGVLAVNLAQAQAKPEEGVSQEGVSQEARTRFPVDSASVLVAMQRKQLPTKDVHVEMAVPITALSAEPELEVQSVALVDTHEIRLRMSCRNSAECLPFFATATYPEAVDEKALVVKHEQPAAALAAVEQRSPLSSLAHAGTVAAGLDAAGETPILKAGSPAMLEIDSDRIHIRLGVICLAEGAAGEKIRVTTRDHKQTYVAQIVTPTQLKGSLSE